MFKVCPFCPYEDFEHIRLSIQPKPYSLWRVMSWVKDREAGSSTILSSQHIYVLEDLIYSG